MPYKKRQSRLVLYLSFLIGLLPHSSVFSQKKWTIDDILHTERIVSATISPDGKYVFYQTGFTADGYYPVKPSKFYVITADGKKTTELTLSPSKQPPQQTVPVTSPDPHSRLLRWSPDSKYISYLASQTSSQNQRQVWVVSPFGMEPLQITQSDNSVSDFEWSPDGKKLLYVTDMPTSQEELEYKKEWGTVLSPEERRWPHKKKIWVKDIQTGAVLELTGAILLSGTPKWSHDSQEVAFVGVDGNEEPQLFIIDIEHRYHQARKIHIADEGVRYFSWSPTRKAIACITAKKKDADYANYHEDAGLEAGSVWLYESNGNLRKIIDKAFPQITSFNWSRKGEKIAFIANAAEAESGKVYHRYMPLFMYVLSVPDGSIQVLAKGMDFFRGGESITWSADDDTIWFVNGEGVGYNLFAADVRTGVVRHVTAGKDCQNLASFDDTFTKVAFVRQSVNMKPDIYVSDVARWNPKRITDINPWVKDFSNEKGEIFTYFNDGWEIEALLIKPPGFNPKKKYPLIVVAHGGPNWHKLNEWQPDWEQYPLKAYAAEGYVMFFPNFRGSANYGVEFIKTTHHDLGGKDFWDVMKGVDCLLSQGYIDENRMGICGWSYGGFLTPTVITKTNRFKAAQFGAGLPSIEGMYASLWTVERILHKAFDSYPWDDGAMHLRYSPLYHADKVKTPTLIQHGDKDPRCPVGGAILFYKALKSHGVPTVLEIYPGMGHSITDPLLYKRILTKNLEWFNKWLKNDTSTSFEYMFQDSVSQ